MYFRHDAGFLANSKFTQMRRASALQQPQRVFIFLIRNTATVTLILDCHFLAAAAAAAGAICDTSFAAPQRTKSLAAALASEIPILICFFIFLAPYPFDIRMV
jgi:hypothetical protein